MNTNINDPTHLEQLNQLYEPWKQAALDHPRVPPHNLTPEKIKEMKEKWERDYEERHNNVL